MPCASLMLSAGTIAVDEMDEFSTLQGAYSLVGEEEQSLGCNDKAI